VPNFSEGRDQATIDALSAALGSHARLLDVHSDGDHNRSVFTLVGSGEQLVEGLFAGVACASQEIDLRYQVGAHPRIGAADVIPLVPLAPEDAGRAGKAALQLAQRVGEELELPVFLYGELATDPGHVERADLRRGGPAELARRIEAGELVPDYGPARAHPSAGAVLATARPPLVAFNVDLDSDDVELAKRIAAGLRESGGGLPGVRAIGLSLPARGRAQVSTNVHDHRAVPLREIVARVREQAPVAEAELVGLAPAAALEGFPEDLPLRGFVPERHIVENAIEAVG
jgi:glutamate formiminotransferase